MTNKTTTIRIELTQAETAFREALQQLTATRTEFTEGAGKAYSELMDRHADLRRKIAAHESSAEAATQEFKRLLEAANYEKTKPVKEALFSKNDALSIAEELREALADSERTSLTAQAGASRAAERYADSHDKAYGAYARLEAYKALAESEEALTRALALLVHVPDAHGAERHVEDVRAYRMKFVWDRLTTQALQRPEAERQPEVLALGALELGAFAGRAYLTPVKVMQLQRAQVTETA